MFARLLISLGIILLPMLVRADSWVRVPNETLQLPQKPGSFGYRLVDALNVAFDRPVDLVFDPSNPNQLFVAEQAGRIVVVTNMSAPTRTVLLDLTPSTVLWANEGLFAIALHPKYSENGRIFLHRMVRTPGDTNGTKFNQISEFQLIPGTPPRVNLNEKVLIRQPFMSQDHAGGDLEFGPDGYLYGSFGDGLDAALHTQRIDGDFFSAVWRIDVDELPGSLAPNPHPSSIGGYRIPPDNPYVGAIRFLDRAVNPDEVRTEFWSVGLRNPFRITFDRATGELWVGDVGENSAESVFLTSPGANHGWPYREGDLPGILLGSVPSDFLVNPEYRYVPPVYAYPHSLGKSVIVGDVYRGTRLPGLTGALLISDHSWGWMGAVRRNNFGGGEIEGLAVYLPFVTDLVENPVTGEVWVSEVDGSRLWRLDHTDVFTGDPIPETLAETGVFSNLETLSPAAGVVPYEIVQSFWSDDARKRRWFSVPDVNQHLGFAQDAAWSAPTGTVWIKHFDLELTNGVPESSRRLETRIIVRQPSGVYGLTYRWDSATNATLVPAEGVDEDITRVIDGVTVTQRWRYPSRAECLSCHSSRAGFSLSFNTAQLNREITLNGETTHQIAAWIAAGYVTNAPSSLRNQPKLAALHDESASLEWRVRSYLEVNCSYCHQPGGAGLGKFDARLETPTALAGLVNGSLNHQRGDEANRVIAPGDTAHSILLHRLSVRGADQMPPLASSIPDQAGATLIQAWIESLEPDPGPEPVATLRPVLDSTGLRLQATQPTNRAVRLEWTTDLLSNAWNPLDLPGTEREFPATPRALEFAPPATDGPAFYRILTIAP